MLTEFIKKFFNGLPFEILLGIIWGAFAVIFVSSAIGGRFSKRVQNTARQLMRHVLNIFTALTLAAFSLRGDIPLAIFASALFWCIGYILCGVFHIKGKDKSNSGDVIVSELQIDRPAPKIKRNIDINPLPQTGVKLEHALSVTERLLQKNLGKSDRQVAETLKNTLSVFKVKGALSPAEGEILNDNFNTLLKLMAKYNV